MSYNKKSILVEARVYRLYIKSSKWNDTLQWLISWLTLHTAALFVLFSTLNVLFVCDDVGIKLEWDWIEFRDQLALILDTQHISIIRQGLYSPHLRWHHELNCYYIIYRVEWIHELFPWFSTNMLCSRYNRLISCKSWRHVPQLTSGYRVEGTTLIGYRVYRVEGTHGLCIAGLLPIAHKVVTHLLQENCAITPRYICSFHLVITI